MSELNFSKIIQVLKINSKKLILTILILDILLVSYSFIMPQMFKSELVILPPKNSSSGSSLSNFISSLGGAGLSIGGVGESKSGLYADILKSKTVANKVSKRLSLDTLSMFSKFNELELQNLLSSMIETKVDKSGLIRLVCELKTDYLADENEIEFTKNLVKELTDAFGIALDEVLKDKNNSSAKSSRIYIENEIDKYKIKLDSVSVALQKFQEENNILEIEEQTQAIVKNAIDLGSKILEYENELNLAKLQMNPNSSSIKILEDQVVLMKSQYARIQDGGLADDNFSIPLSKVPDLARRFADLYRDREIVEKVLLYLETQRHQEFIQEEKDTPVIEILDYAYKPIKKSAPQRSLMLILGTIIFSIFTSIFIVYRAYKKGSLEIN
jgi:uncharacterized protein involved in exopolysaccharide biosynthesis